MKIIDTVWAATGPCSTGHRGRWRQCQKQRGELRSEDTQPTRSPRTGLSLDSGRSRAHSQKSSHPSKPPSRNKWAERERFRQCPCRFQILRSLVSHSWPLPSLPSHSSLSWNTCDCFMVSLEPCSLKSGCCLEQSRPGSGGNKEAGGLGVMPRFPDCLPQRAWDLGFDAQHAI